MGQAAADAPGGQDPNQQGLTPEEHDKGDDDPESE